MSWENISQKILPFTDLFIYDIKAFTEELHIEGTGASNKTILKNLKKLSDIFKGDIIIKIPIIGGYNDNVDEINRIASYLKNIAYKSVELLPYHKMGENKYPALNMNSTRYHTPSSETMKLFQAIFTK